MKPEPVETCVETYLRRATRGLWGKKRLEVREELAAHLHERVTAFRIGGLGEVDAVNKALSELGKPQEVSLGMARLYTLPTVISSSLTFVALCLAVMTLWPKGSAQTLQGTSYWPTRECLNSIKGSPKKESSECTKVFGDFWVSINELKKVLEPQGVEFEKVRFQPGISKVTVPDSTPFFIEANPSINMFGVGTTSRGYLSLWNVVERFSALPTGHVRISGGWDNPTIHLNEVSLQLQDGGQPVEGNEFYGNYLMTVISEGLDNNFYEKSNGDFNLVFPENFAQVKSSQRRASLQTAGGHNDVYGLLTYFELPNPEGRKEATLGFQLARTTDSGEARVWLPKEKTTFLDSFSAEDKLKLGQSLLIRLAGGNSQSGGWYEITSPKKVTFISAP